MSEPSEKERLKTLEARIAAAKQTQAPTSHMEQHHSQAQLAWRMVIELVTGLIIGFAIGYGLDALFNTRPIFMVVFVLLGFIAGVKTMIRSANEIQARIEDEAADKAAQERRDQTRGD